MNLWNKKTINLTLPIYNEETILKENVQKILDFLGSSGLNDHYQLWIILVDNASTDQTATIAQNFIPLLGKEGLGEVDYLFIPQKGKGLAIKTAWEKFRADYYIFMDADLATDLEALPRLIQELENGADLVIGSRYLPQSKTQRSFARLLISKIYRQIAKTWLGLPFSDLPCGFKGVNHKLITSLIPLIKNNEWFFDTELLFRAHRAGYQIKEIPVTWTETLNQKRKSRVGIIRVSWNYLKALLRLKFQS